MERTLTKKNALAIFKEDRKGEEFWRTLDSIAKRESWGNYTDSLCRAGSISLCKDNMITMSQYERWSNPF